MEPAKRVAVTAAATALLCWRLAGWRYQPSIYARDNLLNLVVHLSRKVQHLIRLNPRAEPGTADAEAIAAFKLDNRKIQERLWRAAMTKQRVRGRSNQALGATHVWRHDTQQVPVEAAKGSSGGNGGGSDNGTSIDVHLMIPSLRHDARTGELVHATADADPSTLRPLPIVVWFHGGGMALGAARDAALARLLSRFADGDVGEVVIASVEYRMTPDFRFPVPVDDCLAATRFLAANGARLLGVDAGANLSLAGASAGGNLAAVVHQACVREGIPVRFAVYLIPMVYHGATTASYREWGGRVACLPTEIMLWFWEAYLRDPRREAGDWRVSPIAGELSALGPCLVATCSADPLKDEAVELYEALRGAGVDAAYVAACGSHAFGLMFDTRAMAEIMARFRAAIGLSFRREDVAEWASG